MIEEASVDGWPPVERSCVPVSHTKNAHTMTMPTTHPNRNARLFARARPENSIRITAMIGIGLAATPTANGRTSPIVCPIVTFPRCPRVHSRAIIATASFSRSMNGSPETSTMASLIVPPVNANGLVPG